MELRNGLVDRAVGLLSAALADAARDLRKLSRSTQEPAWVRSGALRELFSQHNALKAFSSLESRIRELERGADGKPDTAA